MTTKTRIPKHSRNAPKFKPEGKLAASFPPAKDPETEQAKAKLMLSPAAAAAVASIEYMKPFGEPDLAALVQDLSESMKQVHEGNLKRSESMLIGQAHALQAIFMHLARRSARCETLKQIEMDLRLALKAQAQCCRTLEVLSAMKNPPVVLARQANVTTGPQQINNGTPAPGMAPARGNANSEQNELLESNHVERMEPGTESKAGRSHPAMEAMEEIHRAANQ